MNLNFAGPTTNPGMPTDKKVVENRHLLEHFSMLKRPCNPDLGDMVWLASDQFMLSESNTAPSRPINAADAVQYARLPRAVWAN